LTGVDLTTCREQLFSNQLYMRAGKKCLRKKQNYIDVPNQLKNPYLAQLRFMIPIKEVR
jgi:hypothetical protein